MIKRKKTKVVKIGKVRIGGNFPIAIQSMTKVPTRNVAKTVGQIRDLSNIGCEIIRGAVKDEQDTKALKIIKKEIDLPLVADIHFHYRLALKAIEAGVDKIRINPGNIFKKEEIKTVTSLAKDRKIPIRIGVNSGSLRDCYLKEKDIKKALLKQTKDAVRLFEDYGFDNIVISIKSSNIADTINVYREISKIYKYPLHLGITATGLLNEGIVKSSIGIGVLLSEGIGDTIRTSLLGDSREEVYCAKNILSALGLRSFGPQYVCCPTCGRCSVDLCKKIDEFQKKLKNGSSIDSSKLHRLTIAFMGCMVNGPGEAKQADIGIAFGSGKGVLFKKGRLIKAIKQDRCIDILLDHLKGD